MSIKRNGYRLAVSISILVYSSPAVMFAADAFSFGPKLGVAYDNNVGLAARSDDKRDDVIARIGGLLNYTALQTGHHEIKLGAEINYDHFFDLTDLSNVGITGSVLYRGQFSPDFMAPWFSLQAKATGLDYRDSDIRNGYKVHFTAALGKRLNEKFGISAGYRYQLRRATDDNPKQVPPVNPNWKPNEVFDQDRQGVFAHLDFAPGVSSTLYGEYSFFTGDVASTGRSFNNGATFTRARDLAFGPGFIVWKIDADVHVGELGFRYRIGENANVDVSGQYLKALGESDNDYEAVVVKAKGVYRF